MKEARLAREIKGPKGRILVILARVSKKLRKVKAMSLATRGTKPTLTKSDQRSPRPEGNMTNEGNKGERTQEGVNQTRKQNEPATQKPGGEEKERTTGKERRSPTP